MTNKLLQMVELIQWPFLPDAFLPQELQTTISIC